MVTTALVEFQTTVGLYIRDFKRVNVCFNRVILILLAMDDFKTCIKHVKKPCSDEDALWKFLSRCLTQSHYVFRNNLNVLPSFHWYKIAYIYISIK